MRSLRRRFWSARAPAAITAETTFLERSKKLNKTPRIRQAVPSRPRAHALRAQRYSLTEFKRLASRRLCSKWNNRSVTSYYINILLSNILRQLDEQGMSKKEFAETAKISQSFFSDITSGKGNPSLKIMERIANTLNTPLPTLLEATDLDQQTRIELAGEKTNLANSSLPKGYERVSAILTTFEAYEVKQFHEKNVKRIKKESIKTSHRSRVSKAQ